LSELKKRKTELDAREKVVAQKEARLNDETLLKRIDILTKQIETKQATYDEWCTKIADITDIYDSKASGITEVERNIADLEKQEKRALSSFEATKDEIDKKLVVKRRELSAINDEISEAKRYRAEQETLTDDAIADCNARLVEFQSEANLVQEDKNKLSASVIRLEQELQARQEDIATANLKLSALNDSYASKAATYRHNLQDMSDQIESKEKTMASFEATYHNRDIELKARESSVNIREVAQRRTENNLIQKERRLRMSYGIAGMDYE